VLATAATGIPTFQATSTLYGVGTPGYVLSFQNGAAVWVATSSINNGVSSLVAGTGISVSASTGAVTVTNTIGYPFALTGNATSTLTQFNGGLTAYASTTIGNGNQNGGLTISGGATTTGNAYFAGNVGIGTVVPSQKVQVAGNIVVGTGTGDGNNRYVAFSTNYDTWALGGRQDDGSFRIVNGSNIDSSSPVLTVSAANNIGIGSTSPWGLLSINPTAAIGSAPQFVIGSSTGTSFIVTNGGNVGIGTTTTNPTYALQVSGGANNSTALFYNPNANTNTQVVIRTSVTTDGTVANSPLLVENHSGTIVAAIREDGVLYGQTLSTTDNSTAALNQPGATGLGSNLAGVDLNSVGSIGWSNSGAYWNQVDTALSRYAAGVLAVGTTAQGSVAGTLLAANIGVGTTSPYAKLSVAGQVVANNFFATSTTATSTFAGGLVGTGLTQLANAELGAMTFDTNAGTVSWTDIPLTSAALSGTIESYTASLGGTPALTVYGTANGSGGLTTGPFVGIGTTSPAATLSVVGSTYLAGSLYATSSVQFTALTSGLLNANSTGLLSTIATSSLYGTGTGGQVLGWSNVTGGLAFIATSSSGGTNYWTLSGNNLYNNSGTNLGIGSTSPWAQLSVNPTASNASAPSFVVGSSTGTKFIIDNGGNVGIGTSAALSQKLVVITGDAKTAVFSSDTAIGAGPGSGSMAGIEFNYNSGTGNNGNNIARIMGNTESGGGGDLMFQTAPNSSGTYATKMVILQGGNVGIGTTSPTKTLTVQGTNSLISNDVAPGQTTGSALFEALSDNGQGVLQYGLLGSAKTGTTFGVSNAGLAVMYTTTYNSVHPTGLAIGTFGPQPLIFGTNASEAMRLTSTGNVGIGSTSPWAQLSVNPNGISGPAFAIGSSTGTLFKVDNKGNVTISNGGNANASPTLTLNDTTSSVIPSMLFQQGGTTKGQIEAGVGLTQSLFFDIGTTRFMSVGYGGNTVQIGRNFSGTALNSIPVNDGLLVEGSVGIGTTTPMWALDIASTTGSQLALSAGAGIAQWTFRNAGGNLYLSTTTVAGNATSTMPALTILNNGNLGLGTSSPMAAFTLVASSTNALRIDNAGSNVLTVDSTQTSNNAGIDITAGGSQTGNLLNLYSSGGTPLAFFTAAAGFQQNISSSTALRIQNGSGSDVFVVNSTSGNVGVGSTTPGSRLVVQGTIPGVGDTAPASYAATIENDSPVGTGGALLLKVGATTPNSSNQWIEFVDGNGNERGSIEGNSGNVNYYTPSDARLKTNVADTSKGLSDLMNIQIKDFSFTSDPAHAMQTGFIAQNLYTVFPDAVTTNNSSGTSTLGGSVHPWMVDYGRVTPLLVRSIQQLNTKFASSFGTFDTTNAPTTTPSLSVDAVGNVTIGAGVTNSASTTSQKFVVSGNMLAGAYEAAQSPVTSFTLGTTTVTATIPSAVLTVGGNVDLYKLATYNLSGVQALAAAIDAANMRITSLETRVAALEDGAITATSGSPITLSTSSLASAFSAVGAYIKSGLAQFGTLVADQFVAATNSAGTSSAGTVTILAGNTVAQVNNAYAHPSTKVFVTFNSQLSGNWYVANKQEGSFRVVLSAPQTGDVSFDYFLVQTEGQATTTVATSTDMGPSVILSNSLTGSSTPPVTPPSNNPPPTPPATSTPPSDTVPPVVTLVGDAAMQITTGDTFTDPGATATDNVDGNLTTHIIVSGTVDTATAGLYTLTYSATDAAGNTGTASRTVSVVAPPPPPPADGTTTP
jgi:hypothetical protein